jgi:hypothetical protein
MVTTHNDGTPMVETACYRLTCAGDRPFVYLDDAAGERLAELFVLSAVQPWHGRDDTVSTGAWQVAEGPDEVVLSLPAASSAWQEKVYRFRCRPQGFSYEIEVAGHGLLAEVHPFAGYYSGNLRWGSGFFVSGQRFRRLFNPEPNTAEENYATPTTSSAIDLGGVPLPGRADWFFTPPPFCFAVEGPRGWVSLGLEPAAGANAFSSYHYRGQRDAFHLSLHYDGQTAVDGRYVLPAVTFHFAPDEYAALGAHVAALRAAGAVPPAGRAAPAAWWREPIFCGWGAQCHLAGQAKAHPAGYARQELYEQFLATLAQHGVRPGIVVLDDKWQASYGNNEVDEAKWPDLPGFIERQHRYGRHVLLWLKAWDPEGVPVDECITNAAGQAVAVDPTNPAYERRLRSVVRRMLSGDAYGADGFKIDFSARIPSGPGLCLHGAAWGLELMKRYLAIIYDEAKSTKPDALIMTHTPHPYLADVLDMIRLNDMNVGRDIVAAMRHRARVAAIACPDALIDTDNWPITDRAAWRRYLPLQAELGVPSLYYSSHVDATGEPLEEEDYALIRNVWAAYARRR